MTTTTNAEDLRARVIEIIADTWGQGKRIDVAADEVIAALSTAGAAAGQTEQWYRLFSEVAKLVKCLPSSFPDGNGHVIKKLRALVEQAPSDGASMPEGWSVSVEVFGERLVCIESNALCGKRDLTEADEQAITGAAQHLLAFIGYGLPPSSFDPDADDEQPSPVVAEPTGWTTLPGPMPEPGKAILLDIGKKTPIRAMWAAKHTVEASDEADIGWCDYSEADDVYYCPEGWYEWNEQDETHWSVDASKARAWMPLPLPLPPAPKE